MQRVFQLADVARPGILHQRGKAFFTEPQLRPAQTAGIERQEVVSQHGNVLAPLAQRRQGDGGHVKAVEEIFTKAAFTDRMGQVDVRGGNDPHIDLHRAAGAHAGDFTFL